MKEENKRAFNVMEESFDSLFPLGIISKPYLSCKIFQCDISNCGCFSAIWRAQMIIFSKSSQVVLTPSEWIPLLRKVRLTPMESRSDIEITNEIETMVTSSIVQTYLWLSSKLNATQLNRIALIVNMLLPKKFSSKFLNGLCILVCRLFYQFTKEAVVPDGTIKSELLNQEYIDIDIYVCAYHAIETYSMLFRNEDRWLTQQISDQLQVICSTIDRQMPQIQPKDLKIILSLYQTFFRDMSTPEESPMIMTALFDQFPQFSIFHQILLVSYFHHNKAIVVEPIPATLVLRMTGIWILPMQKEEKKDDICKICEIINQLISELEMNDSLIVRHVIKIQLNTIIRIVKKKGKVGELIPISVIKRAAAEINR